MIYYQVKTKKENIRIKAKEKWYNDFIFLNYFFVANELVTKKELEKILQKEKYNVFSFECEEIEKKQYSYTFDELINMCFNIVNINKNKTGYFFGARIALDKKIKNKKRGYKNEIYFIQ